MDDAAADEPGNVGCDRGDELRRDHILQLHELAHHVFEKLCKKIERVIVHLNLRLTWCARDRGIWGEGQRVQRQLGVNRCFNRGRGHIYA